MRAFVFLSALLLSFKGLTAEQQYLVTQVDIQGEVVLFKTHPQKQVTQLSCVEPSLQAHWGVDLNVPGNVNIYSLVLGAFDSQTPVTITSKQACIAGVEAVKAIGVIK
ncbi:hypothetical protein JF50_10155 [Pseudoalteromonas luteoviolacea]|uniref:Uncharacterized protein n=1 Tax=Pseudoalteromonas luteoviolacea TaxID=43657 RepID=A0A0C1QA62_9GAMM|nr:hypothetical protein [Pseudoalteromonas luteoviolacea]KID57541.1 hypothetical protein JF50_10155 [Pseudoalteromonas luteoviolacea]